MVKQAGTEEAIDRFRRMANPERYRQGAEQTKDELIQRGEQLLLQYDLNEDDPNLNEKDRELVRGQIKDSIKSVMWRVAECDEIIESFKIGAEAGLNRAIRRKLLKENKKVKSHLRLVPPSDSSDIDEGEDIEEDIED